MGFLNMATMILMCGALIKQGETVTTTKKGTTSKKSTSNKMTTTKMTTTMKAIPTTTTTAAPAAATTTMAGAATKTTTAAPMMETTKAPMMTTTMPPTTMPATTMPETTTKQATTTTRMATTATLQDPATTVTVQGVLQINIAGANKSQVETATKGSIASATGVDESKVEVDAVKARRLDEAPLRKLADAWTVTFTIRVPAHETAKVEALNTKVAQVLSDSTSLIATLSTQLVAAGVPQSAVTAMTAQLLSIEIVVTTTTMGAAMTQAPGGPTATMTQAPGGPSQAPTQAPTQAPGGPSTTSVYSEVTGGTSLPETAFLSIIFISTIVMTFMM